MGQRSWRIPWRISWRMSWRMSWIIILFVVLSLAFSLIVPVFDAPDEPYHFEYMRFLAEHRKLPNQTVAELSLTTEGFNPPLYYLIGAMPLGILSRDNASDIGIHTEQDLMDLAYNPDAGFSKRIYPPLNPAYIKLGRGRERNMFLTTSQDKFPFSGSIRVIHLIRLISIIFGALTVFFVFKTAETLFPDRKGVALLAAGLCAFNPQFTFLSGVLNNDNLVTMFSTISLYLLTKLIISERDKPKLKWLLGLGATLGLGLISKVNISFLVVISGLGLIYQAMSGAAGGRERKLTQKLIGMIRNLALFLLPIAAISGWFFVRNVSIFGLDDPLGWKLQAIQNPELVMPGQIRAQFIKYSLGPRLFTSFWGQFDWLTIRLPSWAYWIYGLISLMFLVGVAIFLLAGAGGDKTGGKKSKMERRTKRAAVCLWLYLAAIFMAVTNIIILDLSFFSDQGRLIFPVIAPLCIFMALGTGSVLDRLSRLFKIKPGLLVYSFILLQIGLNLYSLIAVVYPIYR
jgi:4-amino-4-deoxy-L-arabinose transferase-like glycosyltransferase